MTKFLNNVLTIVLLFTISLAMGQSGDQKSISEKTKDMRKYEGYFNFYYDESEDKIYIEINSFNEEFLYVNSLPAGVGSNNIGLDRAQLGSSRIVRFERRGPKVLMIQPNYDYRAVSDNEAEVKAVTDAFAESVLWGFKVAAEDNGSVLIDASSFLLRDAHGISNRLRFGRQGSYSLDASRSAMYLPRTKNFPENSEFEATITFKGRAEGGYIRSVTPSSDAVTVRMHHSFVKLPGPGYEPREFDPRSSFNSMSYMDYATPISENIVKRFIPRHRLKRKDVNAERSEAVEPIIYYLDPGTPEPIRSALLDGARWWNQAFEEAGYINAFQVEMLPEDADPMDVRYNVINWVHRSTRGWSYGSSVRDPRTGEIIKGHVTLGSLRVRQDFLIAEGLLAPYENGNTVPPEMEEMALARLRQLSAHEVGHTIGLSHNYTSSMDDRASVMDYPHPVASVDGRGNISLDNAYDDKIGAWDRVSINFGYREFPQGTDEKAELNKILSDAYQNRNLSYLSDQDARPTGGAHPRAHLWDNGSNSAEELDRVMEVRAAAIKKFGENNIRNGEPMATLKEVLVPIYFFHRYQLEAAVKSVGGLDYTYALRGDWQDPTEMIDPKEQDQALESILATIQPDALALPESLLEQIPPRPIGYRRSSEIIQLRTGLTFDPMAAAETASNMAMELLFHPARATRLVEYHSRDSKQPGLSGVINYTLDNTWKKKKDVGYEGQIARTVDMVVLRNLMRLSIDEDASEQVRATTMYEINSLDSWLKAEANNVGDEIQRAHLLYASSEIQRFKNEPGEFKDLNSLNPPAGSPIGMDLEYCSSN